VTSTPTLLRKLGLLSATALVISNMIGVGVFGTTGFIAGDLGTPNLVLLIWVVGALCALCGAVCYSELGINFPRSGGEYVYLTEAYGPTWGFMTGWVSFFAGFSATIAAVALAFADYLGHFFPSVAEANSAVLFGSGDLTFRLGGAQLVATVVIIILTILNVIGVERVAKVQNVLTAIKIGVILTFILLGIAIGQGSIANFSLTTERTSQTPLAGQFAVSLFYLYLSYSGWNAAVYVAEELKQPERTLPRALALGTLVVTLLYLGLNCVFLYAAPVGELKGQVAVGALAASKLFGPQITGIFTALMAVSLLSTINAMVTVGPRVYYAMAQDGAFLSAAAKVHPQFRTPVFAIVAQGVCSILMTITPFPQLVTYIGFSLNLFAAMAVASLFVFRKRAGWQKTRVVSFCYPLLPILFLIVAAWMTYYGVLLRPYISLAVVLTVASGAVAYHLKRRSA
jgi:APA family basic amino acid/polyamine antiporter